MWMVRIRGDVELRLQKTTLVIVMPLKPTLSHSHDSRESMHVGAHSCFLKASQMAAQIVLPNTQSRRMWLIVSSSWSQNRHASWCGSPHLASRSEVEHLFCMTSHANKWHGDGALDFQFSSAVATTARTPTEPHYPS